MNKNTLQCREYCLRDNETKKFGLRNKYKNVLQTPICIKSRMIRYTRIIFVGLWIAYVQAERMKLIDEPMDAIKRAKQEIIFFSYRILITTMRIANVTVKKCSKSFVYRIMKILFIVSNDNRIIRPSSILFKKKKTCSGLQSPISTSSVVHARPTITTTTVLLILYRKVAIRVHDPLGFVLLLLLFSRLPRFVCIVIYIYKMKTHKPLDR